ncbi:hypothetical protein [Peribacillus acanthi]|uniref:hypothetical protein n=1 Tax=Peribacillus acanthi TaxID=2171554 RepID=UPI00130090F8|nr:hypothetical protein [Peribacillus acanthi]
MQREEVIYNGVIYHIIHRYESGYLEIQDPEIKFKVKLVHQNDVKKLNDYFEDLSKPIY